ncbi:hypothetical protein T492DRAFT_950653 [Pavlovales sp. CCMP2436]|nr:hypothetical protein T492DRAFT_950653 [Pavlovales sp. CCMP2436]
MRHGPGLLGAGLLVLQHAAGWVTLPNDYVSKKIAWPLPEDVLDDTGLGGGIAFSLDANFCKNLLPMFKEDDQQAQIQVFAFVACADINDSIARAMSTWSSNHPYIDFYNVTDDCVELGKGVDCPLAELYIDSKPPVAGNEQVAAFVLHNPLDLGREYGTTWETGVRAPSGNTIGGDWQIKFTTLTFHNHICWYLDNTFCAPFRILNESVNATLLMQFIIWGLWAISFLVLFLRVAQIFFYVFRFGTKVGVRRAIQAQSRDMLYTYILLFLLISPPIVWFKIFIPCLTCYDFEATAAHEIGHVLGFTHTDQYPEKNRVETEVYNENLCGWNRGVPGQSGSKVILDPNYPGIDDSIMFHLTTKKSKGISAVQEEEEDFAKGFFFFFFTRGLTRSGSIHMPNLGRRKSGAAPKPAENGPTKAADLNNFAASSNTNTNTPPPPTDASKSGWGAAAKK